MHLDSMLHILDPLLTDHHKARLILERYWQDRMALVWTAEDIHRAANQNGQVFTRLEARQMLQRLLQRHTKFQGLDWFSLGQAVARSGLGRRATKAQLKRFKQQDIVAVAQ
jgi:predicted flavoprotein YhiN